MQQLDLMSGILPVLLTRQKMVVLSDYLYKCLMPSQFRVVFMDTDNFVLLLDGCDLKDCLRPEMRTFFEKTQSTIFNWETKILAPEQGKLTKKMHLTEADHWYFRATSRFNHIIQTQDKNIAKRKLTGFNFPNEIAHSVLKYLKVNKEGRFPVPHVSKHGMSDKEMSVASFPLNMRKECQTCKALVGSYPDFIIDSFPML